MIKIEKQLNKLPDAPGVYLFYDASGELIYVGKATSLRSRVRSYFRGQRTPRPIEEMIHEVAEIKWKQTDSVLEAIIMEANRIKKHQPKYNVLGKDDKSWNYIVISKDAYPMVGTLRQHEFVQMGEREVKDTYKYVFGPYPGLNTKATMKLLRKLFVFSTCKPDAKRQCLYYEMKECLGVCTGEISAKEYNERVIKPLVMFLRGSKKRLITSLEKRMKDASKAHDYEEAARLRDQVSALSRIHDIALINKSFFDNELKAQRDAVERIEGYDISNLGATGKVGSMVVFTNGEPDKSQYRKFKIKTVEGQSDVDSLEEVLRRRFKHDEWPFPQVLLIDGGMPQVNRTKNILKELDINIPVVGIAKGPKRKKNDFFLGSKVKDFVLWVSQHQQLLIRVRDEAHRFAISYQRKTRKLK